MQIYLAWIFKKLSSYRKASSTVVSLSVSSRFQFSAPWWVVFMSVYGGESFSPGMLTCAPARSLAAESAQRAMASCQYAEAGHCLFSGCPPPPQQWTVALCKSENHLRTKLGWEQVKPGAGWRGEEDGGVPASPYFKKKKKANWKKKLIIETQR